MLFSVFMRETAINLKRYILEASKLTLVCYFLFRCPPCKGFTPVLTDFYNNQAKDGNFEIVYVSSDKDMDEFNGYFAKMPWVAQPVDAESAQKKTEIAQALKIQSIPCLIVLDAKTGKFVKDTARIDVAEAGTDKEKQKEVLEKWKAIEAVPLDEAEFSGGGGPMTMSGFFYTLLKNPAFIMAVLYGVKYLMKMWVKYQQKKTLESGEGDVGSGEL